MRVVVQPYKGGSKSAKALAEHLGVKRLKVHGSRFVGKIEDVIINWGSQKTVAGRARVLNKPYNVALASNKLRAFNCFTANGVSCPEWDTDTRFVTNGKTYVARTKLSGHSGEGIEVFTASPDNLYPEAPLYTEYIEKVAEYRAIVVGNEVVDFKQKKKRSSPRDDDGNIIEEERINHDEHVWNLDGGYVFARDNVSKPDGIDSLACSAVSALGLDFGAVDIIMDRSGNLFVLEVNTAFGLEGTTVELVGEAIKGIL